MWGEKVFFHRRKFSHAKKIYIYSDIRAHHGSPRCQRKGNAGVREREKKTWSGAAEEGVNTRGDHSLQMEISGKSLLPRRHRETPVRPQERKTSHEEITHCRWK